MHYVMLLLIPFGFLLILPHPALGQQGTADSVHAPRMFCLDAPLIGYWQGHAVTEGGASGLAPIPGRNSEFWMVNDRGPNIPADHHPLADGRAIKLFPFPNYAQKLMRFRLTDGAMEILEIIPIRNPEGRSVTGIPIPEGLSEYQEWAWSDGEGTLIEPDQWGMDLEALVLDGDTMAWIADEYRPAIYQLHVPSGTITDALVPGQKSNGGLILPEVLAFRQPNRGFEALALSPRGILYALLQSPLHFPDPVSVQGNRLNRLLSIDRARGQVETLVYPMNPPRGGVAVSKWKIGDMYAVSEHTLLVLEHGSSGEEVFADIYLVDLRGATPIPASFSTPEGALEAFAHPDSLTALTGIVPVRKTHLLDLVSAGFDPRNAKPEGMALLDPRTIAVLQDNDYGLHSPQEDGQVLPTGVRTCLTLFILDEDLHMD